MFGLITLVLLTKYLMGIDIAIRMILLGALRMTEQK